MADDIIKIKQIRTGAGVHEIDAKYWGGYQFSDLEGILHGVVSTYVISKSNGEPSEDYKDVVYSTESLLENIDKDTLSSLIGDTTIVFKLGDIILMEETSDGTKVFDRWVSAINGDKITLAVLETQVATHHHTIDITADTNTAYTSVSKQTPTSKTMATVGTAVDVITGVENVDENENGDFVKSVTFSNVSSGGWDFTITNVSTSASGAVAHSHTVNIPKTVVSETVNVITNLSTSSYTTHKHSSEEVAGKVSSSSTINYVTGASDFGQFLTNVGTETVTTTGNTLTVTDANTSGTTSTQVSGELTGDSVKTTSNGGHTHTVSVTTGENVVTSATVAPSVITSINFVPGNVQSNVVTSVTTENITVATSWQNADTDSFVKTWECNVDASGILSFTATSANAVTSATTLTSSSSVKVIETVTSDSQTNSSLTPTSFNQEVKNENITLSGYAETSGSHTHGFTHTHTIGEHTHSIGEHTHTYVKTVVSDSHFANAITSLSTASDTWHTHASTVISVAAEAKDEETITYVYGGDKAEVVKTLTSSSESISTDTVYQKVDGDIEFPGLDIVYKKFKKDSIIPAESTNETPIVSIEFTKGDFVTSVTSGTIKTSENKGGSPS